MIEPLLIQFTTPRISEQSRPGTKPLFFQTQTAKFQSGSPESLRWIVILQVKLIELLQGDLNQITVVGDDFQSIYGFRGALPDVFPNFIEQFSHENLNQSLQMNYRFAFYAL